MTPWAVVPEDMGKDEESGLLLLYLRGPGSFTLMFAQKESSGEIALH